MPNQLAKESSPYLLQHADNPVDWYPWGSVALEKARREDKPIFLSIGYAACHWCHVMERESFVDAEVADFLNRHFVSIKVDREERPDLDSIYMEAVVSLTGQGGWPMSVFLTPEGKPFYGGTYFPPVARHGMPAFLDVLQNIAHLWETKSDQIFAAAEQISQQLVKSNQLRTSSGNTPAGETLKTASEHLVDTYDWKYGGWGAAPKFPAPMAIDFLLQQTTRGDKRALPPAVHALEQMQRGGIYDLIGGGFHRYSTDSKWLVPHFEKMLYDNAQLALVYLHAYLLTANTTFRATCEQTLEFLRREMTDAVGGFYSSLDADSQGIEGIYYTWTPTEIKAALQNPEDVVLIHQIYQISSDGNFEGRNILRRPSDASTLAEALQMPMADYQARLNRIHQELLRARTDRVKPSQDDKVLVSWNALALRAFAEAARYLNRNDYLAVARKNTDFLLRALHPHKRLLRSWHRGAARHNAYLEDYAALVVALLSLYQSDPDLRWYQHAEHLTQEMLDAFSDIENGGFFDTRSDHEALITRPKTIQDNATPSGNALAAQALLLMAAYNGNSSWEERAHAMLVELQPVMERYPLAFAYWLQALDFAVGPVKQIALLWSPNETQPQAMLDLIWKTYRPRTVLAATAYPPSQTAPALLHHRPLLQGKTTAYVCEGFVCHTPVNDSALLSQQLDEA